MASLPTPFRLYYYFQFFWHTEQPCTTGNASPHYIMISWLSTLSRLVTSCISGMSIQKALGSTVIFHCLARLASVYHRKHFAALISLRHSVLSGSMLEHITLFRHQSCRRPLWTLPSLLPSLFLYKRRTFATLPTPVTRSGRGLWLFTGWTILPTCISYCRNTNWTRCFQCKSNNLHDRRMQTYNYFAQ